MSSEIVERDATDPDLERKMKLNMLAAAFNHEPKVGLAANTALELSGVSIGDNASFEIPDFILPALRGLDRKANLLDGPLLIRTEGETKRKFTLFNVSEFLFHKDLKVRGAALAHFERMIGMKDPVLILRSERAINNNSKELRSNDVSRWKHAAVAIGDALKNDFLLNLSGFRQCLGIGYDQGASEFFSQLIRPSVDSIDTIPLKTPNPTSQKAEIVKAIDDIVRISKSLKQACEAYYREFGHIPLLGPLSMGGLIEAWTRVKGSQQNVWAEVRRWANESKRVLAKYHACQVFSQLPSYIPADKQGEFWKQVTNLIVPLDAEGDRAQLSNLQLLCILTKHFIHYLECQLPGEDSERIAVGSFAIAERLASVLAERAEVPGWVLNSIQWDGEISRRTWQITHPVTKNSNLQLAALYDSDLWGSSLLGAVSTSLDKLDLAGVESGALDRLADGIVGGMIEGLPLTLSNEDSPTFSFQVSTKTAAETWIRKLATGKSVEKIEAFLKAKENLENEDFFGNTLPQLLKLRPAEQVLVLAALRGLAFTAKFPEDLVWKTLTERAEDTDLLAQLDPLAVDALLSALLTFQARQGGKWAFELPHVFAQACERVSEDSDRQELLFDCTVLLSTASGTVSAIERLLAGSQKQKLQPVAVSWRERILELIKVSPPWAAGRMRGILASLPSL